MDNENITSEALASTDVTNDIVVVDGGEAVGNATGAISLEEVAKALGKDFKDKESFLKSVKDTYQYVGKAGQIEKEYKELKSKSAASNNAETESAIVKELRQIKSDLFFKDNPQYSGYRQAIEQMGENPAAVVETAAFKQLFDKAIGYDKSQSLKSVLESNPRIAQSSSKLQEARKAMQNGRTEEAHAAAAAAVIEAYGM
jgi:hypothetical protein